MKIAILLTILAGLLKNAWLAWRITRREPKELA